MEKYLPRSSSIANRRSEQVIGSQLTTDLPFCALTQSRRNGMPLVECVFQEPPESSARNGRISRRASISGAGPAAGPRVFGSGHGIREASSINGATPNSAESSVQEPLPSKRHEWKVRTHFDREPAFKALFLRRLATRNYFSFARAAGCILVCPQRARLPSRKVPSRRYWEFQMASSTGSSFRGWLFEPFRRLDRRFLSCGLAAGQYDPVEAVVNLGRGNKIPHRGLQ